MAQWVAHVNKYLPNKYNDKANALHVISLEVAPRIRSHLNIYANSTYGLTKGTLWSVEYHDYQAEQESHALVNSRAKIDILNRMWVDVAIYTLSSNISVDAMKYSTMIHK